MSIISKEYENYLKRYDRVSELPIQHKGKENKSSSVLSLPSRLYHDGTNEEKGLSVEGVSEIKADIPSLLGRKVRSKTIKTNKKGKTNDRS